MTGIGDCVLANQHLRSSPKAPTLLLQVPGAKYSSRCLWCWCRAHLAGCGCGWRCTVKVPLLSPVALKIDLACPGRGNDGSWCVLFCAVMRGCGKDVRIVRRRNDSLAATTGKETFRGARSNARRVQCLMSGNLHQATAQDAVKQG